MVKRNPLRNAAKKTVIIGAGMAGLVSALMLALAGVEVVVCETAATPGGKLREINHGAARIDAGPTVFTMLPVFEAIFTAAGTTLQAHVALEKLPILARHAWDSEARLDLFADLEASVEAIGDFAGARSAALYRDFSRRAAKIYDTLDRTFMHAPQPGLLGLIRNAGLKHGGSLLGISPFATLWGELGKYFPDPRLRQLFARYATYSGASPFSAPATLMLIAHAEQRGVWRLQGGMHSLAVALANLATANGAKFHYNCEVAEILTQSGRVSGVRLGNGEVMAADAVLANADVAALAMGNFGKPAAAAMAGAMKNAVRSLSALTWAVSGTATGAALEHHNVFFGADYEGEFKAIAQGRMPPDATLYLCAPDAKRFFCLINAPANGDTHILSQREIDQCWTQIQARLNRSGVQLLADQITVTQPAAFNAMFPATGGALYGRALRSWQDPFARPGSATKLPGLYLAGGSVHPGPGLPMAARSGQLAAERMIADFGSMRRYVPAAMPGGISMPSVMTGSTL
jgi:1-hydroxycarotenoid 3,4-desaturase